MTISDWCRFAVGEDVVWHHESRGGYGYVSHVPAKVVGIGAKRVRIEVGLVGGDTKTLWVTADRLRLPSEECGVPVCAATRRLSSTNW